MPTLRQQIPEPRCVIIDNEYVVRGELPEAMRDGRVLRVAALPTFLKTYIDRLSFSFTGYLRSEKDSSTELHQWIRRNYFSFRELELSLICSGLARCSRRPGIRPDDEKLNARRTTSACAPARPSRVASPRRRGPAGR